MATPCEQEDAILARLLGVILLVLLTAYVLTPNSLISVDEYGVVGHVDEVAAFVVIYLLVSCQLSTTASMIFVAGLIVITLALVTTPAVVSESRAGASVL
jgi:hypothetical protein